jgi:molybdopterin synthase catalytic subunit
MKKQRPSLGQNWIGRVGQISIGANTLADLAMLMCEKRKAAYHQVAVFMDTTTK